jgi:hypothetical protein
MSPDHIIFTGVELSSGSKPVTFAALDGDLRVQVLEKWTIAEALSCLNEYENIWLSINLSSFKREQAVYTEFKKKIIQAGFKSFSVKGSVAGSRQTPRIVSRSDRSKPLPRVLWRRLQRSAILYEQGLQIAIRWKSSRDHALQADAGDFAARRYLLSERIGRAGCSLRCVAGG